MEPLTITMSREVGKNSLKKKGNDAVVKERHPGDGMESYTLDDHIKLASSLYKKSPRINILSPVNVTTKKLNKQDNSFSDISSDSIADNYERKNEDLTVLVDSLQTQLQLFQNHNDLLIEEKMRLSQQLGVQTQVNNELKKLLIASIGEDLQIKYERLILDKSQSDLELKHLHNVLVEDREEVEQAMIQADVWRSKFLASRVMSDELARWKSALYYKYRESHTALQGLLEEHSKIRALNNATRRSLVKVTEILKCKDPSLDSQSPLTTVDVAFVNHDLADALVEIMEENTLHTKSKQTTNKIEKIEIKNVEMKNEKGKNNLNKCVYVEANELSPTEQLAHEVVINTGIQTEELTRMRKDYLAHNRISHFLSTNYHVTFSCCESCTGQLKIM